MNTLNSIDPNSFRLRGVGETLSSPVEKAPGGEGKPGEANFKDLLKGLVDQVNTLQKEADASIKGLATGETTNVHDVTVKMEEAGIAFDLMMEIRNKLVDAYQQIIKMQS